MIEKREISALMKAVSRVVKEYVTDAVSGVSRRVDDLERRQAEMPMPKDGKDADPEMVRAAVQSEVAVLADAFASGLAGSAGEFAHSTPVKALEVDSQLLRASVEIVTSLATAVSNQATRVDATLASVAASSNRTERSVEKLAAVLKMPVKPIYDKRGIFQGGMRVEKLEESNE